MAHTVNRITRCVAFVLTEYTLEAKRVIFWYMGLGKSHIGDLVAEVKARRSGEGFRQLIR